MEYQKETDLICPECNTEHKVIRYERILGNKEPELKSRLLKNELFRFRCENCGLELPMVYPCLYQDVEKGYMVWFVPASDTEQLEKIASFNAESLLEDKYKDLGKQYKLRIALSVNGLIEKLLIFDEDLDDRAIEVQKAMLVGQLKQTAKYRDDAVRGVFFEFKGRDNYEYTVLFKEAGPVAVSLDMEQYYKIYLGNRQMLDANTPEGFALIQEKWGVERSQEIIKESVKQGRRRRRR